MNKFTKTTLATLITFATAGASAAAFQIAEISASGLGSAYSGNAASTDNASAVATNPALMTQFKKAEIAVGGVFIDADVDVDGTFAGKKAAHKNVIPTAIVPNLYAVAPINDKFALGGGVNVNYGLKSEFGKEFNAGVFGGKTDLTAINLNLSGAYNLGYGVSFGVGVNAIHTKAEVTRYLGDAGKALVGGLSARLPQLVASGKVSPTQVAQLSAAGQALAKMPSSTVVSQLKGDKWAFGWNVGLSYDINENNRIGIAYHSPVDVKFKGKYSNDFPTQYNALINQLTALGVQAPVAEATGGNQIPGRLTLNLPAYWEISGYHKLTSQFAVQYSYKRTQWSRFKSLDAYSNNGKNLFHKDEKFSDASRIALGFIYDVNEALTLRTGIAFDESASVKHPTISIPDTDRTWYSVGATYRFTPNLSTDIGYAHLRGSKNSFNEDGKAQFAVKAKANLVGLNVNYRF